MVIVSIVMLPIMFGSMIGLMWSVEGSRKKGKPGSEQDTQGSGAMTVFWAWANFVSCIVFFISLCIAAIGEAVFTGPTP